MHKQAGTRAGNHKRHTHTHTHTHTRQMPAHQQCYTSHKALIEYEDGEPQAQKDTSRATAASRLRSLTAFHDGGSPLTRVQQHKARLFSCASRASSIWLTALPIHNVLTLSNSAFCNAFQFRLGLPRWPLEAPRVRCGCGPLVDPRRGRPTQTSSNTPKRAPNSSPHDLRATTFSEELGARSCSRQGCPPGWSRTARRSQGRILSPPLVPGLTS